MNALIEKKWFAHTVAIAIAVLAIFIYFNPLMSGKQLKQHDVQQWEASYHEADVFQKASGERTFWTNSIFGGMPTFLIGPHYYYNFTSKIGYFLSNSFPNPSDTLLLLFVCFYILLLSFNVSPWLAIIGGLAFMFSSFNFLNIDAGHVGKGNAIAYIPLVLAGINITLRRNRLFGALFTGIALSLQLAAGHVQITYYLMLIIMAWMIAEVIIAIRHKQIKHLALCGIFLAVAAIIGVATDAASLMATEEYGKYSIRGSSELTKTSDGGATAAVASSGLDKDYALQWSNGVSEPFTLLIPNFFGGGSAGDPHSTDVMTDYFKSQNFPQAKELARSVPAYFGDLPSTAGPIYFGAVICFLFVLGLFVVKGPTRWWILAITALSILLSMGRNFMSLTDLFFYHFPLYNKFRSVTFILVIAQTTFPLLAILAIKQFMEGTTTKEELRKALYYATGITGGLCLLFLAIPDMAGTASLLDERMRQSGYPMDMILGSREKLRQSDAFRSLIFILLSAAALWFFVAKKLKPVHLGLALGVLVLIDLWGVDKRFVNDGDFEVKKKTQDAQFPKSQADEVILQDKDIDYRVYNTTQRLDQDAFTSYWHKSIGGYHGAKMRRYQELIEFHLAKGTPEAFNMLNVKYFIVGDSAGNLYPQRNPDANGSVWFVKKYELVNNADAEIDSLYHFNSKETAIIDKRYAAQVDKLQLASDSNAHIRLTSYAPNKMVYESDAASPQVAVFSAIYYEKGWNAYIDDKPADHFRCDYVLRGMAVPAGKHVITYKFEPAVVTAGETISLTASILLYGSIVVVGGIGFMRRKKDDENKKAA